MNSTNTKRESNRVNALVTEYRRLGYEVKSPVARDDVPSFLRDFNYLPDILAESLSERLVVEVKSRETASDLSFLSHVAERVNSEPGWKFVLVLTNPKQHRNGETSPSSEKVAQLLEKSKNVYQDRAAQVEAAFLFAWSALEAALRLEVPESKSSRVHRSIASLIRDAAIAGLLERSDVRLLERYSKVRSSVLHAGSEPVPQAHDVDQIRRIAMELLEASARAD